MKNSCLILVGLVCVVLNGCAGTGYKSGYFIKEDRLSIMASHYAMVNYAVSMEAISHEEAQVVLKPMSEILNSPAEVNQDLFMKIYKLKTQEWKQTTTYYSTFYDAESIKKDIRAAVVKELSTWGKEYTRAAIEMQSTLTQELHEQQAAFLHELTNTFNNISIAANQPVTLQPYSGRSPSVTFGGSNPNKVNSYLINTEKGLVQKKCKTLPNGTVYCY